MLVGGPHAPVEGDRRITRATRARATRARATRARATRTGGVVPREDAVGDPRRHGRPRRGLDRRRHRGRPPPRADRAEPTGPTEPIEPTEPRSRHADPPARAEVVGHGIELQHPAGHPSQARADALDEAPRQAAQPRRRVDDPPQVCVIAGLRRHRREQRVGAAGAHLLLPRREVAHGVVLPGDDADVVGVARGPHESPRLQVHLDDRPRAPPHRDVAEQEPRAGRCEVGGGEQARHGGAHDEVGTR